MKTLHKINPNNLKIESNIPIPPRGNVITTGYSWLHRKMKLGDSFHLNGTTNTVCAVVVGLKHASKGKFLYSYRRDGKGFRVWKLKGNKNGTASRKDGINT